MGNDNVVKGSVRAPEAREPDLDHHFVRLGQICRGLAGPDLSLVMDSTGVDGCQFEVHWPPGWKFWGPQTGQSDALTIHEPAPTLIRHTQAGHQWFTSML